ncbi:hypothetical protein AFLA70_14g005780 [Aspergillus flavus AF70]|nr:hypothetical protein AFLA70_14g005780 [Aspergillus flavus AF70]
MAEFRIFIDVLHNFVGFRDGSGKKGPNQGDKEDNVRDELHALGNMSFEVLV